MDGRLEAVLQAATPLISAMSTHSPIVSLRHATRLLNACIATEPGLRFVYGRRYQWVRRRYMSALGVATTSLYSTDADLLAKAWDMLSGIHSMNLARRPALAAGRIALHFNPMDEDITANYADLCREYGLYSEAIAVLTRYLAERESASLADLLRDIRIDDSVSAPPLYRSNDLDVVTNELLSEGRFDDALNALKGKRSLKAMLARARAYGAKQDMRSALQEWRDIERDSTAKVSLAAADWFFLPDELTDSPEIWHIMLNILPRMHKTCAPIHESLGRLDSLRTPKILELMFRYNIARTSNDLSLMKELSDRFPTWEEARRWIGTAIAMPGMSTSVEMGPK